MKMSIVIPDFAGMTVSLPDFSPFAFQILFSKNHQDKAGTDQDATDDMVDPCHRLHATEAADTMRNKAFQQVRRQRCGQNAGKKYSGGSVIGAIPGTDGNNYRNPDKPDAGVKDVQEKALDDIQMVLFPEIDEFPVLIRVCLHTPFVEGVKTQNYQNHTADDLKPHIVPGIDVQKLHNAEKTKEQNKDVAKKNSDGQTHPSPETSVETGLNQSEKPRTQ